MSESTKTPVSTQQSYGSEPDQIFERYSSDSLHAPTLLLIHGGYWRTQFDREHFRPVAEKLAFEGFEVILAEYRRIPGDPKATTTDIDMLIEMLSKEKLILIGYSAGGQLALLAAPKFSNVVGIIGLAPVTDLEQTEKLGLGEKAVQAWLQSPAIEHPELNPLRGKVNSIPTVFIHGTNDDRVPIHLSENYVDQFKSRGGDISLHKLEGLGHFDLMDPNSVAYSHLIEAIRAF